MRIAALALCATVTSGAMAKQSDSATPTPSSTVEPADPAAARTAMSQPSNTMTKDELKRQPKQQKPDEAAANATTKASRARADVAKGQRRIQNSQR